MTYWPNLYQSCCCLASNVSTIESLDGSDSMSFVEHSSCFLFNWSFDVFFHQFSLWLFFPAISNFQFMFIICFKWEFLWFSICFFNYLVFYEPFCFLFKLIFYSDFCWFAFLVSSLVSAGFLVRGELKERASIYRRHIW